MHMDEWASAISSAYKVLMNAQIKTLKPILLAGSLAYAGRFMFKHCKWFGATLRHMGCSPVSRRCHTTHKGTGTAHLYPGAAIAGGSLHSPLGPPCGSDDKSPLCCRM